MKNLLTAVLLGAFVFPTVPTAKSQDIDAKVDALMPSIKAAVENAAAHNHHYVYYRLPRWSVSEAIEIRYRLEKLGFWIDNNDGPLFIHWS